MSSIRATNPKIIRIAEIFSKKYPDVSLADMLEAACEGGDKKAIVFLTTQPILCRNAEKLLHIENFEESHAYKKYLCAVAQAQTNLLYEGSEYEQIKQLIETNFIQPRHKDVFQTIVNIAGELSNVVNAETETRFLNYLIDQFTDIELTKKNGKRIFVGDVDSELTSGKNGFILRAFQAEDVKNLFIEAALF